MRFEATGQILDEYGENLLAKVRLEVEAESLFLAIDDALLILQKDYPGKRISVVAKEICP